MIKKILVFIRDQELVVLDHNNKKIGGFKFTLGNGMAGIVLRNTVLAKEKRTFSLRVVRKESNYNKCGRVILLAEIGKQEPTAFILDWFSAEMFRNYSQDGKAHDQYIIGVEQNEDGGKDIAWIYIYVSVNITTVDLIYETIEEWFANPEHKKLIKDIMTRPSRKK